VFIDDFHDVADLTPSLSNIEQSPVFQPLAFDE